MATERVRRVLYLVAVVCTVAGTIAVKDHLGSSSTWLDALYGSLQLFTLSMPDGPAGSGVSGWLNLFRFLAPAVTASALVVAFASYARAWVDLTQARRMAGHDVVCGDSVAAVEIAIALCSASRPASRLRARRRRRRKVVAIADHFSESTVDRMRGVGVRVLQLSCDVPDFERILREAERVVVAQPEDSSTLRWSVAAREAFRGGIAGSNAPRVQALLRRPLPREVAEHVGLDGMEISSVVERVAQGAITLLPLEQLGDGPPHAVLVAAAPVAWPLATRLWASAGRGPAPEIALFGPQPTQAFPGFVATGGFASNLQTFEVGWHEAASAVTAFLRSNRQTMPVGNPVYVWTGDASIDIEVALSIVAGSPGVRVVVISDSVDVPRTSQLGSMAARELSFIGVADSVATGQLLGASLAEMIASSLYSEFRRMVIPGHPTVEGVHFLGLSATVPPADAEDVQFHRLAEQVIDTSRAAGLSIVQLRSSRLSLSATEIRSIALGLHEWLAGSNSESEGKTWLWNRLPAFELAARLPAVLEFVGLTFRASTVAPNVHQLTPAQSLQIAHMIHQRYAARADMQTVTLHATIGHRHDPNLAQALDYPLKLALVGYEMRPTDSETLAVPEDASPGRSGSAWLSDDELEFLAEVEHQRWCRDRRMSGWTFANQRDNDLRLHPDLRAYADLPDAVKDKDRQPILDIPILLREIGIGIAPTVPKV